MTKPNLFLVGAPKSGTTSMHRYLGQHPDIFMCEFKEPRYFATDLHRESDQFHGRPSYFPIRTESEYLAVFRDASQERIVGEASPLYLFSKQAAASIHNFAPEAKILIMLRNPVDFLDSWYAELTARLHESSGSLEEALALEPRRRQGEEIPKTVGTPSFLFYSEWTHYAPQILRFKERFPDEQIYIAVFEDFAEATSRVYREVLAFLGVDPTFEADLSIHNPAKVPRFRTLRRIMRNPRAWNTARRLIPGSAYAKVEGALATLLTVEQAKPQLDPRLRERLVEQLRPNVEELSRLLGRDFVRLWGYDGSSTGTGKTAGESGT